MIDFVKRLTRMFRPSIPVPAEYQDVFKHLYAEIAWFGVLSGTIVAFIAVYATRQGASPQQIGMLSAAPALVNLLFALPAGSWLSRQHMGRAVFWTSVIQRSFYLVLIPLPVMLLPNTQVWVILATTLVMTIPATAMVVGFNSLFGEIVPFEWRGQVVGTRNAVLSVATTVFTLISGEILNRVPFPTGYQIVFALGVFGAAMSSLNLYYLSRLAGSQPVEKTNGNDPVAVAASRRIANIYQRGLASLRLDAMKGKFAQIMGLLFLWHVIHFMAIPVVTPFIVNDLHISDQLIGISASLFNGFMAVGSLWLSGMSARFGNHRLTGFGVMGLSLFPILTSTGVFGYMAANAIGGIAWAMAGGALYNYVLENIPAEDRPAHLAWYSLVINGAILIGSMTGPMIAPQIGFATALLIFGFGRLLAGAAILRWG